MRKQAEKKQEQVRPDGDIRADRRTDAGVDGAHAPITTVFVPGT